MAKTGAVWGIDIGQCALKALRCRPHESDPARLIAEAFDYIEYPKILSQPEADADALVREALKEFLSRNEVGSDRVAISVSGQSGLVRFIKLPPVESKKIPDIVKYEAKQQIPFALEDVVWDYQQMAGGSVEEGFALETEVGLFAMKRDQVYRSLQSLTESGIGVDFIQLTPLAIFNYVAFDRVHDLPPSEEYDPANPPPSTVIISLGTDTTDLVVTNGYRIWQRSVPIGGNHFTRALTKEMRLTFSKAEHMKCNATKAENPRAIFKAMRPVFGDLVAEIDRSLGYFAGIDRSATIGDVIAMGNALKLPGLKRYLSDNLKHPVQAITSFRGLTGDAVVGDPRFKDNILSFCVSYGLCVQGVGRAKISTNLLPHEIVTERLVREKKPWGVAAVATLMLGCAISFYGHFAAWQSVDIDSRADFKAVLDDAKRVDQSRKKYESDYKEALTRFETVDAIGKNLVGNVEGRLLWLELFKAIHAALPHDPPEKKPTKIADRRELHIESLDCERFEDLSTWFKPIAAKYAADSQAIRGPDSGQTAAGSPAAGEAVASGNDKAETDAGPSGPGWVVELRGYHYHNDRGAHGERGGNFVRNTLIKNLHEANVRLPGGAEGGVPIRDLGIGYATLVQESRIYDPEPKNDPNSPSMRGEDAARRGGNAEGNKDQTPEVQMVQRMDFVVQFCWTETPPSARALIAKERGEAAAAKAAAADGGETDRVATSKAAAGEE